jgi:hypothetical protein
MINLKEKDKLNYPRLKEYIFDSTEIFNNILRISADDNNLKSDNEINITNIR